MKPVLLNFSGHGLSANAANELTERFESIENLPFESIDFSRDVETQLKAIVQRVKAPLDGSVGITVVLPGHSTLAVLLIIYLFGLLGSVPNLCLMEPVGFGEYRPTNVFHLDLHKLRAQARAFRQESLRG